MGNDWDSEGSREGELRGIYWNLFSILEWAVLALVSKNCLKDLEIINKIKTAAAKLWRNELP